jgi:metallophosphoesterase (TIGR03767 family)
LERTVIRILAAAMALFATALVAQAGAAELSGKTTVQQRIGGDGAPVFQFLGQEAGEAHLVREDLGAGQAGREGRRTSLIYFGQLSDFQLADEESPARVEFFDTQPAVNFASSGHRPHETLTPHQVEAMIRQLNSFGSSPVLQGNGQPAQMANVIATGDLADSMQRNETEWVLTLLEGGNLNPGSGTGNLDPVCKLLKPGMADRANPSRYTGVQDYDDYVESQAFYDPESPVGPFNGWPTYPKLVDRAQVPFTAQGLDVPSYVAVGNHDVLVQGNEDANLAFELVAKGCVKPIGPFSSASPDSNSVEDVLDPAYLAGLLATDPGKVGIVPPDSNRQYVNKAQQRGIYMSGAQSDDHGFAYVDPAELSASGNSAMYYSFSPRPGIRFISLDTNTSGGGFLIDPITQDTTAEGNLDDPQFQWLGRELDAAEAAGELVITYAHHASTSMDFSLPDELATPCTVPDGHGHDINPGCDADPRSSSPIRTSQDFVQLLSEHPNVIAHVAGHSHENDVIPHPGPAGGGWWEIKSPAIADWPAQSRLLEVMDNGDGTLSIFGTLVDHDSPIAAPSSGTDLGSAGVEDLASLGRTISFNDSQHDGAAAAGTPADRNVELLVPDPR